jgi:uncharacterized membrane protein YphA (DoxX/SURF4 family)
MDQTHSGILKRALLLFLSFYFLLYMFPFPIDQIPGASLVLDYYGKGMDGLALWFGKTVLHLSALRKIEMTGSGDTTLDYVRLLLTALLALIAAVVTLLIDKKKRNFQSFFSGIRLYARYYLGLYLLVYGFGKIFPSQFSAPDVFRMEETFGNSSPMGLLWTFMGASKAFTIFSGLMEVIAGYLLFFRRTKTLGALVSLAVMTNVAMMNFCYDVPVKLFSVHLVIISILVMGPDIVKLARFLTGRPSEPLEYDTYVYDKKYKRILSRWGKGVLLAVFSLLFIDQGYEALSNPESLSPTAKDDGIYKPSLIILDKDTLLANHKQVPGKILITGDYIALQGRGDSLRYYKSSWDTVAHTLHLTYNKDSTKQYTFAYRKENGSLSLNGDWNGRPLQAVFRKNNSSKYLLSSRGFHWVNEYPFNR